MDRLQREAELLPVRYQEMDKPGCPVEQGMMLQECWAVVLELARRPASVRQVQRKGWVELQIHPVERYLAVERHKDLFVLGGKDMDFAAEHQDRRLVVQRHKGLPGLQDRLQGCYLAVEHHKD